MKELAEILKPIKDAIVVMESDKCTLADCYYELIKLAASIKSIPIEYHHNLIVDGMNLILMSIWLHIFYTQDIEVL